MNSRSNNKPGSINAFDFDLGLGSGRTKPMKDQKSQTTAYTYSSAQQKPNTTASWTQQPNKPAWTHQPAASAQSGMAGSLSGPPSMVGDIFGKSWNSPAPSNSSVSSIGLVNSKNPNLFGDLLSSAIGQDKSNSNVPLKNAAPAASRSTFSMGNVVDSLPKTGSSAKTTETLGSNVGSSGGNVNFSSNFTRSSSLGAGNVNLSGNNNTNPNIGSTSMKSMAGIGVGGGGMGVNKDPFVSLVDFGSKPIGGKTSADKETDKINSGNDLFGEFQNATTKTSAPSFSPLDDFEFSNSQTQSNNSGNDPFGEFQNATSTTSASSFSPLDDFGFSNSQTQSNNSGNDPFGEFQNAPSKASASSFSPLDDFGFSNNQTRTQNQPSGTSSGTNDFDALFSSSSDGGVKGSEGFASLNDDWGINSEFGTGNDAGGTTELEGLPPPPAGVSAQSAKNKGMDNYKQGQFADAIKWLSWAVVLLEKATDDDGTMEVLTCRASCYKEVGEYKKAVADCTKVLGHDATNVSVLVQRALLYESMEKYKLGAEDLRTVMKLDPSNRVARSTVHRLTKMAG